MDFEESVDDEKLNVALDQETLMILMLKNADAAAGMNFPAFFHISGMASW